jgi:hypothetical protein
MFLIMLRVVGRTAGVVVTDASCWRILLELMIPPNYRLGCTVAARPSRFRVVPGSNPGLAILFSCRYFVIDWRQVALTVDRPVTHQI